MQVSARILGEEYGLTAEEMNRVLVKLGYLEGIPGDYSPTEKANKFVQEKYYHRGNGGYPSYNQYWTTRTFDDSIKEYLNVTPEIVQEVRSEIEDARNARHAAQMASRVKADEDYHARQLAVKATEEAAECKSEQTEKIVRICKKIGFVVLIILSGLAIGYIVYKIVQIIRASKKKDQQKDVEKEE